MDWAQEDHEFVAANRLGCVRWPVARPTMGITVEHFLEPESKRLLGSFGALSELPASNRLIDAFCRAGEARASYADSDEYPLRTHVTWRLISHNGWQVSPTGADDWTVLEMVLSTQTDLLDAQPFSLIESRVRGARMEFIELDSVEPTTVAGCLDPFELDYQAPWACLMRWTDVVGVACVHPSDLEAPLTVVDPGGDERVLRAHMKFQQMEKGVIRRARLLVALVPSNHESALIGLAQQFRHAAAPLAI